MIKTLVVSDNLDLVSFIQDLTKNKAEYNIDYNFSEINKCPHDFIALGMSAVNLKDEHSVELIIKIYDLVISAHCKQIFPAQLVKSIRCINIHPGLNPYNRGWFPQVFSILNKKPIGCTIHLMDEEIDHGAIIYQNRVEMHSWDTSLDLYNRVVEAEKELISTHLSDLINENYDLWLPSNEGNYNGIKDFSKLKGLDLTSEGTLLEHIDLLRALTHGDYDNAYFIDAKGNKVFVRLELSKNEA